MAASSFNSLIQKCSSLTQIKQLQTYLITTGVFQLHPSRTKLLEFCAISAFGSLNFANHIFHQIQIPTTNDWNTIIRGLARSEQPIEAIIYYQKMVRNLKKLDPLTCSFALKACSRILALVEAKQIQSQLLRFGFQADALLQTTLLDVYAKAGDLDSAQQLFDEMCRRDIATWNALIAGLAQGNRPNEALNLFKRMRFAEGFKPNEVTVCNAVIDMYSKCGSIDNALNVFQTMCCTKTIVSWNTMIMGLALHGHGSDALKLFKEMRPSGIQPDAVTNLAALFACNHGGLVSEGLDLFKSMSDSGISPNVKHFGSVVDLLGRAGRVEEAYEIIKSMPVVPDVVLWQSLLGAVKTYKNVEMAERASRALVEMGSSSCGDFVLLSNIYASYERWDDVGRVREAMKNRAVKKIPGFSFIEVKGVIHKFQR